MDALKSCPFCGAKVTIEEPIVAGEERWVRHEPRVGGNNCGMDGFSSFNVEGDFASAWNTRPTPAQEQGLLEEAEAVLERALIGSQKYLRARVRTAISLIEKARHSSTPTEGGEDA